MDRVECVVAGAGVVGLATARRLAQAGLEVVVVEAAGDIGTGTSSRNSEVIHAGIYYPAGSLMARLCVAGKKALYTYCDQRGISYRRCGKLIVATADDERNKLAAIKTHAEANGFSVVRAFVGHGVGTEFHTRPEILHYFHPRNDTVMEVGMTFTIEPMIAVGAWQHQLWDDGWTASTVDGKRTAQFEHTMVVTESGAELLTLRPDGQWSGSGGDPEAS